MCQNVPWLINIWAKICDSIIRAVLLMTDFVMVFTKCDSLIVKPLNVDFINTVYFELMATYLLHSDNCNPIL